MTYGSLCLGNYVWICDWSCPGCHLDGSLYLVPDDCLGLYPGGHPGLGGCPGPGDCTVPGGCTGPGPGPGPGTCDHHDLVFDLLVLLLSATVMVSSFYELPLLPHPVVH